MPVGFEPENEDVKVLSIEKSHTKMSKSKREIGTCSTGADIFVAFQSTSANT